MDKKRLVLWVLVVLTLAFIFGQSLLSQDVSNKESDTVQEIVVESVKKAVAGEKVEKYTRQQVRNFAHVVEYMILGLEFIFLIENKNQTSKWLKTISYCGFIALMDESIQYFSGRGPEVLDVWADIFGAFLGSLIGLVCVMVLQKMNKKKKA